MTIPEFQAYLAEMAAQAGKVRERFPLSGADNLAAQMWKRFTPAALSLWTPPGVLEHIAACMAPPDDLEDTEPDDGDNAA
jgi:hypothetical protein